MALLEVPFPVSRANSASAADLKWLLSVFFVFFVFFAAIGWLASGPSGQRQARDGLPLLRHAGALRLRNDTRRRK